MHLNMINFLLFL